MFCNTAEARKRPARCELAGGQEGWAAVGFYTVQYSTARAICQSGGAL